VHGLLLLVGVLVAKGRFYTLSPLAALYQKGWLLNAYKKGDSKQLRGYANLIKKDFLLDKIGIPY
jgi:hypothetical protein